MDRTNIGQYYAEKAAIYAKVRQEMDIARKNAEIRVYTDQLRAQFPGVSWTNLKTQKNNCRTDDGCIHYLDMSTNTVYSWELYSKKWRLSGKFNQNFAILFDL